VKALIYKLLSLLGVWAVVSVSWFVTTWYFLTQGARRRESERFYRALFPDAEPAAARAMAWRQFHAFAGLFAERLRLARGKKPIYRSEGWDQLEAAGEAGKGGIILMSHLGHWELAARLFRRKGLRLLLYLGARQKEQIEAMQKADLLGDGVKLVVVDEGDKAALSSLEGLRFLKDGGFVSLPGDRVASSGARTVDVQFLGHTITLPQAPYALALVAGAPLLIFFSLRDSDGVYRIICRPIPLEKVPRKERPAAIKRAAQAYADALAEVAREYPEQWYCFDRFLGEKFAS
jgi:predicted LPLAT superfamily acyltransferase